MSKIETLTQVGRKVREELGLTKEDIFWMQIDLGSEFLQVYFPENSLAVATKTNFWDIWVFEWMKDDEALMDCSFWNEIDGEDYYKFKRDINDFKILEQLKTLLEWK